MKIFTTGKEAPIIADITYCHNIEREDKTTGDYIVVNYLGDYKTQVINADSKVDVNSLNSHKLRLKKKKDTQLITLFDLNEQEGQINE